MKDYNEHYMRLDPKSLNTTTGQSQRDLHRILWHWDGNTLDYGDEGWYWVFPSGSPGSNTYETPEDAYLYWADHTSCLPLVQFNLEKRESAALEIIQAVFQYALTDPTGRENLSVTAMGWLRAALKDKSNVELCRLGVTVAKLWLPHYIENKTWMKYRNAAPPQPRPSDYPPGTTHL